MRRCLFLALSALCASPALADPAADYARMRDALPTILFGTDTGLQLKLQTEVLRRLEGRWTIMSPMMADGITFPEADMLARACEKQGYEIERDGTLGLTMALPTETDPFVIRLRYAGGNTYLSTLDEDGVMARLFPGKEVADVDPTLLLHGLVLTGWQGYVTLLPLGDDLVLMQPLVRQPELLARCP